MKVKTCAVILLGLRDESYFVITSNKEKRGFLIQLKGTSVAQKDQPSCRHVKPSANSEELENMALYVEINTYI